MNKNFNNIYDFDYNLSGKGIYDETAGEIYIIQTDFINNNHYKIGKTTNLLTRLSQYRCGSTYEQRLHYYYPFRNILEIDEQIKYLLRDYKFKNEIYIGNIDIFRQIITKLQEKTKNTILEAKPIIRNPLYKCDKCNSACMNKNILNEHLKLCS